MAQVKIALYGALTATGVIMINWVLDLHFITGFLSGWSLSAWFH